MDKRLYDLFWGTTLRTTTTLHRVVHKVSGGRLWRRFPGGGQVVWITTLGRKSGQWRTNPLLSVRDGDAWVVTGSNAGQAKVPGWVFNARDHAEGWIRVDDDAWTARFEEAEGADRDELYERLKGIWKSYETYEANAGRYIPVFRVFPGEPVSLDAIPD
jgi:deazaflavin-dependent oxidoreductase (nitroreductase family)